MHINAFVCLYLHTHIHVVSSYKEWGFWKRWGFLSCLAYIVGGSRILFQSRDRMCISNFRLLSPIKWQQVHWDQALWFFHYKLLFQKLCPTSLRVIMAWCLKVHNRVARFLLANQCRKKTEKVMDFPLSLLK